MAPGPSHVLIKRLLLFALVASGGVAALAGLRTTKPRPPAFVPNPEALPAVVTTIRGIPRVRSATGPERLLPDSVPPDREARVLWFEGRPTQPMGDGAVVVDAAGTLLAFSGRFSARRPPAAVGLRRLTNAAATADGSLWLADDAGGMLLVDASGTIQAERAAPFEHPALAVDGSGSLWVARSTDRFDFHLPADAAPVLVRLGATSEPGTPVGVAVRPEHALLAGLANAGHVAASGDRVFFAPFIRDEVVALGRVGDTMWVASRGLPQSTDDPRFELQDGRAVIAYHPVNLGVAIGPDGNVYVLSTPGFTTASARLDVFEPATGRLIRSAVLDEALPTLAADRDGRVYRLDPNRLLAGVPAAGRPSAPQFELPLLDGGDLRSDDLRGKVVLANLWASWCAPCRDEMPALDSLARRLEGPAFAFLAINEDLDQDDARRFLDQQGLVLTVPLGAGRMQNHFRAFGLPHTVLIDPQGRVVRQWVGFTGQEQLRMIETLARRELAGLAQEGDVAALGGHAH